jgi:hypothetical protein
LIASDAVVAECAQGDPQAAMARMKYFDGVHRVPIDDLLRGLARRLLASAALPAKAEIDALHVAAASVSSADYLLTWNCTHLANAVLRRRIESNVRESGYAPPMICTPFEILESA